MPWIVALLRGQKVLARAKEDGSLAAEGGRVEIRYRKTDPKAYRAAASNLSVVPAEPLVPDDEVVPGAEPTKAQSACPERRSTGPSPSVGKAGRPRTAGEGADGSPFTRTGRAREIPARPERGWS